MTETQYSDNIQTMSGTITPQSTICPHCGRCSHCGGYKNYPYYPYWNTQPYITYTGQNIPQTGLHYSYGVNTIVS